MFRKLLLSALTVLAFTAGLTAAPPFVPTASPPAGFGYHDRGRYEVLVRHRGHWHHYATYRDRDDAERVVRYLERRGYDAKIERVRR